MSIEYSSKLMVGNTSDELLPNILSYALTKYGEDWGSTRDVVDIIEELDFDITSPYFDASLEEWFIGIAIGPLKLNNPEAYVIWKKELDKASERITHLIGEVDLILCSQQHIS